MHERGYSVNHHTIFMVDGFSAGLDAIAEGVMSSLFSPKRLSDTLKFAYSHSNYQMLTASLDSVAEIGNISALLTELKTWAFRELNTEHASTPQLRVFCRGCRRRLVRDATSAQWHYILSLTKQESSSRRALGIDPMTSLPFAKRIVRGRVQYFHLQFNRLIVHRTDQPYSIRELLEASDPAQGLLLLEGYLW